jgi:putative membrane-bound dehydrogenase-like protein
MVFSAEKLFSISLIWLITFTSCVNKSSPEEDQAVPADQALSTFTVADGFQIEMIASEPLVSDPVDMEIDENGRMYVAEMHGYPLDKSGSGKIIVLTDTDGDGKMDQRKIYKDSLLLPTGIMRWKNGLIVTDAPNILYLEDSDNDGVAERTDTILTGFALTNPQHNTNNPVYGIDNWIYVAHEGSVSTRAYQEEFGDEGSDIIFHGDSSAARLPKNANGRSIRFRPDEKLVEMNSSRCQFGHTFDNAGHRFECNNSNQGYHEVLAAKYFDRNPDLLITDATQNMSDHQNAAEVFPTTRHPDRQILTNVGVLTSACGLTFYNGGLFPSPYQDGVTFIAEPVSNLVHADKLIDSGASFVASRVLENKEFLSSSDSWSRPVNFYIGPDGALYVLDYYRRLIESPEWMSDEVVAAGGLYDGSDKGRIYRITPKGTGKAEWTNGLPLGKTDVPGLIKYLSSENYWWRINAQRLLVQRKDSSAVVFLKEIILKNSTSPARIHALYTLDGLNALTTAELSMALKDNDAGVRENAVKLAERYLSVSPELYRVLMPLENDPSPKVRFQLLLTLGNSDNADVRKLRNRMLFADLQQSWMQVAAMTAVSFDAAPLLSEALQKYQTGKSGYASLVEKLSAAAGAKGTATEVNQLVKKALMQQDAEWAASLLTGLSAGIRKRTEPLLFNSAELRNLTGAFFETENDEWAGGALQLIKTITNSEKITSPIAERAVVIANDHTLSERKRAMAVELLQGGDPKSYQDTLRKLIVPQEAVPVQLAAIRVWSTVKDTGISNYLLQQWQLLTPEIKEAAVGTFLNDPQRIALLVDALEKGTVHPEDISFGRSVGLMQNKDENLRNRARAIFTKNQRDRKKVNEQYQASLALQGNIKNGESVYRQQCAICHQVRGTMGIHIGPDLGTIHNWVKEDILANVLQPGLSISSGYDLWEIVLQTGETLQGIIAAETPSAVMLRNHNKSDRTVNRSEIKSITAMHTSIMPAGLEKNISQQEMADLISFLRGVE